MADTPKCWLRITFYASNNVVVDVIKPRRKLLLLPDAEPLMLAPHHAKAGLRDAADPRVEHQANAGTTGTGGEA